MLRCCQLSKIISYSLNETITANGTRHTCSVMGPDWKPALYEPLGEIEKEREKGNSKQGTCSRLKIVSCRIRDFCDSDVCYGNPSFLWNLLGTQEESFRLRSHDCTIFAGLIERQKMQLIPPSACSILAHRTYGRRAGKKLHVCSHFFDIASHSNCSPISLISTRDTIRNPIPSTKIVPIQHVDISFQENTLQNNELDC